MDDGAVGLVIRRLRHRAGLTQAALASRARVSEGTISRIERGHVGSTTLDTMRRIGSTQEVSLDLRLRWRGGELDRLLDRERSGARGGRRT
jgi:transcriptional regulator with XRE-family HTH domain